MNILTVVGARPQFIKAAPVSKELKDAGHSEYLVHTGQHYDYAMSEIFFNEMGIQQPNVNLGIGSGTHGRQTGEMLIQLESVIQEQTPGWVLVYGDTNSTLAGALAAAKLHVPLAHVEAGLRSFNRDMPEEYNRVLTDHCSDLLLCPTQTAVNNLAREGIDLGIHLVGDTMFDAVLQFAEVAQRHSAILNRLGFNAKEYLLATVHRPYNTDNPQNLSSILDALANIGEPVIFPVHPRTRRKIVEFGLDLDGDSPVTLIEPIGYLDMLMLERHASMILTDSGGIQKEAYFFGVPCITLRPETEWVETVESGWNVIVGADKKRILAAVHERNWPTGEPSPIFGRGDAASNITERLTVGPGK